VPRDLEPRDPPRIGPYRLVKVLGSGGMGRVFLGRSAGGRPVAVKVIRADLAADSEFRMRFQREVAAARQVNGLYTALVVDADVDGPVPWLAAAGTVAILRAEAGRDPYDKALIELVGELSSPSALFRTRWATHNVLQHRTGVKTLRHPVVGELTLGYEALELPADTGLTIMAYSAEPATPARDALNPLASWTATTDQNKIPDSETRPSSAS
jgi:hypothetical protein